MSGDVIKEFLVSLGYKVDSSGERRFTDGIKNATKTVTELGLAAGAAAVAVGAAVAKMADRLDTLYFTSQRTKASAENIQALGFAADQMGSSADSAQGSLEALAKFLRVNPGGENLIHSWGVQTRDANDQLLDTTEIMGNLGSVFRNMSYPQAYRRAEVLGIDEKTLMAMIKGMDGFETEYKKILARYGLDTDKAAEQSHQFMLGLRDLRANAEVLGMVIGTKLIGMFDELGYRWNSLDSGTKSNIETFAKWVAGIAIATKAMFMLDAALDANPIGLAIMAIAALGSAILLLWDDYKVWKEGGKSLIDWGKWKPEIDLALAGIQGMIEALKFLKIAFDDVKKAASWMQTSQDNTQHWIGQQFAKLAQDPNISKDSPAYKFYASSARAYGIDPDTGKVLPSETKPDPGSNSTDQSTTSIFDQIRRQMEGLPYTHGVPDSQATPSSSEPIGIQNNNPGNLRTGPNGSFGTYATPMEGLQALRDQLSLYFNGGSAAAGHQHLDTLRDIISTYAPKSENNTAAYISDVAKQMGVTADAQLNLNDPQTMAALMRGIIQHEEGYNPYSSEMINQAAGNNQQAQPTTSGTSLSQSTQITVYGAKDAQATANAVAGEQNQVNQRLARNFQFAAAT